MTSLHAKSAVLGVHFNLYAPEFLAEPKTVERPQKQRFFLLSELQALAADLAVWRFLMDARLNFHFPALPVPEADFIIIELFQFTLPFQAKRTCLPFLFPTCGISPGTASRHLTYIFPKLVFAGWCWLSFHALMHHRGKGTFFFFFLKGGLGWGGGSFFALMGMSLIYGVHVSLSTG